MLVNAISCVIINKGVSLHLFWLVFQTRDLVDPLKYLTSAMEISFIFLETLQARGIFTLI